MQFQARYPAYPVGSNEAKIKSHPDARADLWPGHGHGQPGQVNDWPTTTITWFVSILNIKRGMAFAKMKIPSFLGQSRDLLQDLYRVGRQ